MSSDIIRAKCGKFSPAAAVNTAGESSDTQLPAALAKMEVSLDGVFDKLFTQIN